MLSTDVSPTEFRNVIGHFMSGVTIISTHAGGVDYGMTASAVCSLSLEPPMVVVCLNRKIPSRNAVAESGAFAVSILGQDQGWLAKRFGSPREDKFESIDVLRGTDGVPVVANSLAHLRCRVVEQAEAGTHTVFMAAVTEASSREGHPLAYYRGTFGRFELEQNAEAHAALFTAVLDRRFPVDDVLDPDQLAATMGLSLDAVHDALTRLVSDGLVRRAPEGYLQEPYDVRRTEDTIEAKRTIDLASAARSVGNVTEEQLNELQRLCDDIARTVENDEIVDLDRYRDSSVAFQEYLVSLSGNEVYVESLRRLRVPSILAYAPGLGSTIAAKLVENRQQLVDAFRAADLDAVTSIMNRQADVVADAWVRVLVAEGGRL